MPKLCEYQNCRCRASYGVKRDYPIRCKNHKDDMKLVSRICLCGKARPYYNEPNETTAICCVSCKTPDMVDIKSKQCKCGTKPTYNIPTETTAICCMKCKTGEMINVVDRKCRCGKIPTFNEVNERTAICCVSCKTPTMVDITHKKCKCGLARASFNEPNEKIAICCVACKSNTMVDINHKHCKCGKRPTYNEPNETIAVCCISCKTPTMVDVLNKMCLGAIKDGIIYECPYKMLGNKKYKNYCTRCFLNNFPNDPLTFQIRSKTKEIAVRDFINRHFEGFQHDKILETGHCDCSIRRRIDHRKLIGNTLLVIETDENQHKSYPQMDEQTRYDDLFMAFSGKWIYIRFNPDKYISKKGISKNPMISTRLAQLKQEIERQIERIQKEENKDLIERVYLYYDGFE